MNRVVTIISMFFFFSFCSPEKKTQIYYEFVEKKWHSDSIITFKLPELDTNKEYNLDFKIRHTTKYKYQNIYFFVYHLNKGEVFKKDTIHLFLAEKNGKWKGKGTGNIREARYIYEKKINLKTEDEIKIQQAVRKGNSKELKILEEVKAIGIKIYLNE